MKKMNFKYIDIYIITLEGKMITPSPDIRVKHSTNSSNIRQFIVTGFH